MNQSTSSNTFAKNCVLLNQNSTIIGIDAHNRGDNGGPVIFTVWYTPIPNSDPRIDGNFIASPVVNTIPAGQFVSLASTGTLTVLAGTLISVRITTGNHALSGGATATVILSI
jgi:hypothetical protein